MTDLPPTSRPASSGAGPPTLTARSPEDLLAMVSLLLGFHPQDSLVMLALRAQTPVHARIDLPRTVHDAPHVAEQLLVAVRRHQVSLVAVAAYTGDLEVCAATVSALVEGVEAAGGEVAVGVRAHAGRWFSLSATDPAGADGPGETYEISAHPFLVEAVVRGEVTHASRADLARGIGPDPARVGRIRDALAVLPPGRLDQCEVAAAVGDLLTAVAEDGAVEPRDTALLTWAVADRGVREVVLVQMTRADAPEWVRLWTEVVRGAPEGLVAGPASLLGFAAWLAGRGALAWCAVDRCLADNPEDWLAPYLVTILEQAVPPACWEPSASLPAQHPPSPS